MTDYAKMFGLVRPATARDRQEATKREAEQKAKRKAKRRGTNLGKLLRVALDNPS